MDSSVASVDTLVYQLEDDDASVRWATLQRLRKRAAVERTQLPVRNPRRFLQCLRRRLSDEDPRIARGVLLLLRDLVDVLGDDVDQILSSILPHLVARLPRHTEDADSPLDEDTFSVFRKFVNVANDLAGVANLLVNMGLAHAHASVREAALLTVVRLLDERYGRRRLGDAKQTTARVDAALFTELVQAAVPALEDDDENVVVAAEETIAKIQLFLGGAGFHDVMPHLSSEDKQTLAGHDAAIRAFVDAATNTGAASVSASQVLALRASLPTAASMPMAATTLRFGYVANEIVDALHANRGNSNAEWKKRTAAVEQLYAATKQVDACVLCQAVRGIDDTIGSFSELFEMLMRLLQDIDVHLVKRSIQIQRLLFYKLEPKEVDSQAPCEVTPYIDHVLPAFVETAANYAEDDEITTHVYTLFQTLFSGQTVSVAVFSRALLSSLHHRRLQVREEALKIWIVLLLTAQSQSLSTKGVLNDAVVHALGKALGDGSARVRSMAMEAVAVLGRVTRQDICAILESHVDDFTLERIDLDALYARSRDPRLPSLLENGQLRLLNTKDKATTEAGDAPAVHTRSPVRTSSSSKPSLITGTKSIKAMESTELLDGPSELLQMDPRVSYGASRVPNLRDPQGIGDTNDWRGETADNARSSQPIDPRDVSSAPGEPVVVTEKLQMLKRKTELRKSASSKRVTPNRQFNPQEGDNEFASSGYAAQQYPSPSQCPLIKPLPRTRRKEEEVEEYPQTARRPPTASKAFSTPRATEETKRESPRTPPTKGKEVPTDQYEDRPIRPMRAIDLDEFTTSDDAVETKKRPAVPMSLATKKRLEAKQRQEQGANSFSEEVEETSPKAPSPEAPKPRALSLATRKRQEQAAREKEKTETEPLDVPSKRSSARGGVPPSLGKQEPRYLEPHELLPLKDAKQDAAKVASQLRSDGWEIVFEALNTVRRLATHHPKLLDTQLHSLVTEILKHVPNLRSSVAKNALLALDSLCVSLGKQLDTDVESIVPVLMKRCTDSNTFVCESTSASLHRVIMNCSTVRVVNAIASHTSNRATPIRREVARAMHAVIVGLGDQVSASKDFPTILQVVAKCLEDSHNEVRDAAKQSVVYLHTELNMDADTIKKLLPTSVHSKIEPLLTRRTNYNAKAPAAKPTAKGEKAAVAPRRALVGVVDAEALAVLTKKLDSSNWKGRFDALSEAAAFVGQFSASLCESGKLLTLFDSLLKRMDDGNAKVSTLALELLPSIIASLGNGMELVLQTFVPAVAKGLAASNAKQSALALAAIRALCAHVEARLLCPHIAAVAKHANSRVKPLLLDILTELASSKDETNQFALTRYVLPLALELLKEGKSDVKDVTARLLRALYDALGPTVVQAGSKLSSAQQDRLSAILGL